MNTAASLLSPNRVRCQVAVRSKKRALELIAGLLADDVPGMSTTDVFAALNNRERLGSTGLGQGMALPHGRVPDLDAPIAACATLAQPIDFDAPDRQRVDVLYGLLVPGHCSREHLQILAALAEMFNEPSVREALRAQTEAEGVIDVLARWGDTAGTATG